VRLRDADVLERVMGRVQRPDRDAELLVGVWHRDTDVLERLMERVLGPLDRHGELLDRLRLRDADVLGRRMERVLGPAADLGDLQQRRGRRLRQRNRRGMHDPGLHAG
jgi:hypothetical protein